MIPERLVGRAAPRVEDDRFLRGRGRYLDDIELPGLLHAAIVRSQSPTGSLRGLDRGGCGRRGAGSVALGARAGGGAGTGGRAVAGGLGDPGQRDLGHPLVGRPGPLRRRAGRCGRGGWSRHARRGCARPALDLETEAPAGGRPMRRRAGAGRCRCSTRTGGPTSRRTSESGDSAEHTDAVFADARAGCCARACGWVAWRGRRWSHAASSPSPTPAPASSPSGPRRRRRTP